MLTTREIEVAGLIAKGKTYKEIAKELYISEKTVTKHIQNIFGKAGVSNKVELINKLIY
jgi:DNA-binding NarL/FixJ family response regulator